MKVWIDNKLDQEKEINDNELAEEFLESPIRKTTKKYWPLLRQLTTFLLDKHYTYEVHDFHKLLDLVREKTKSKRK